MRRRFSIPLSGKVLSALFWVSLIFPSFSLALSSDLGRSVLQKDVALSESLNFALDTNTFPWESEPPPRISLTDPPPIQRVAQSQPSRRPDGTTDQQPATGLQGVWERFLEAFSIGAVPDSETGSVRKWFGDRAQILRFSVLGVFTRSKFQGRSNPLEGGNVSGVFAPALRLTEDTAVAVVYNGSYNRELQVFTEDEGPRQQQEEQRHEFIVLLSHDFLDPFGTGFIDRLTVSPSFFQSYVFTRQTADEEWGNGLPWRGVNKFKGLYDYWDRGGGLEIKLVDEGEHRRRDTLSTAFQIYRRHYRNFISLARLLDPASPEPKYEKDYIGYLVRAVYDRMNPGGSTIRMAYTFLQKNFTEDRADKDPLESPGVPGERRTDRTHTVEARGTIPITEVPGLTVGLGGTGIYNMSDSGFNDTLSPLPITGVFTDQYYDYWSFQVSPEIAYSQRVDFPFMGWQVTGILTIGTTYSFERRAYKDRKAKDKSGNLKDQNEVDILHIITPRIVYQFNRAWAVFLQWRRTIARSNFEDERTFRYSYDINSFGVGVQYNY